MKTLPIPNHLKNILIPTGSNNEFSVVGVIKCKCGNDSHYKILFPGETKKNKNEIIPVVTKFNVNYYLIIKVICLNCNNNILIFDDNLHGWNGFVCHDENIPEYPENKLKIWECLKCKSQNHNLKVQINSQGKKDFIDEAGSSYDENDWVNAFDWITISLKCNDCNEESENWISYETM